MRKLFVSTALLSSIVQIGAATADNNRPTPQAVTAAMAMVKIVSQDIKRDPENPRVLVQIKNDSDLAFSWITVSCRIMKGDKFLDVAEAYITNVQPGETVGEQATYSATPENNEADRAICRPAIGL
ncbi:hypothetical protein OHI65_09150 [Brucella sp. MAB-22]|uniref:hypothetical protein n=1 Tax=Brucella sp. MAB-22 TaxID=2986424 RepID=UPI00221FEE64|nr:hypothetical protein [Brucella sp. MAB-22]UYT54522.1 hypothetical protein OHI65_09150 [Brucella sp. MAB-22]